MAAWQGMLSRLEETAETGTVTSEGPDAIWSFVSGVGMPKETANNALVDIGCCSLLGEV
jgi:hypothetical protein